MRKWFKCLAILLLLFFLIGKYNPIYSKLDIPNKRQGINSSTAISSVDLTFSLTIHQVRLNLFMEYIQIEPNNTEYIDRIIIRGDHTDVIVTDEWQRDLLISAEYDSVTEKTEVKYQLPFILDLGEKYTLLIQSDNPISSANNLLQLDTMINWTQPASTFSATVYLDINLILYSVSPAPHSLQIFEKRLKMSWNDVSISFFNLFIEYKITQIYFPISITPNSWHLGYVPENRNIMKQTFTLTNLMDVSINVTIFNNVNWLKIDKTIMLAPLAEKTIEAEIIISSPGEYEGKLAFLTNVSALYIECPVSVIIEESIDPWEIIGIIFITINALLLAIIAYLSSRLLGFKKKSIDSNKINVNMEKIEGLFSENELRILDEIISNPGISQSQIARNLNISKSTVSRIISKFDEKQIIKRDDLGMSNRIYINEKSDIYDFISEDDN